MLVYRGMDVGTAKPAPAERARVPHHLIDVAEPVGAVLGRAVPGARRGRRSERSTRAAAGRCSSAGPVCTSGRWSTIWSSRAPIPRTRSELEREADGARPASGCTQRLAASDPVAAARIEPGNVRRTVRALEVPAITGRPFSTFAEAWERYDVRAVRAAGIRMPREALLARIGVRVRSMLDAGWLDEVRSLVERGFGGWLTSTQAIGYAELARHLRGDMTLDEAVEATVKRTGNLARRQMAWFRRDPRIRWFDVDERGAMTVVEPIRAYLDAPWRTRDGRAASSRSTRGPATTSSCSWTWTTRVPRAGPRRRALRPPHRAWAPTA